MNSNKLRQRNSLIFLHSDAFLIQAKIYAQSLNACQSQNLHAPMTRKLEIIKICSVQKDFGPLSAFILPSFDHHLRSMQSKD